MILWTKYVRPTLQNRHIIFQDLWAWWIICLLLLLTIWLLYLRYREEQTCIEHGDTWQIVRQHIETTYVHINNTVVPDTHTVDDYGCVGGHK